MMNLSDLSDEDLSAIADNQLTKVSDEGLKVIAETPKISMSPLGAMGRGAIRGILPTAAGFVSGSAGAIAGAPAGPAGAIAGGLGLGLAGATATAAAQQKVLEKFPGVAGMVGLSPEEQAVMERHFPYTSLIGESAVGLAGATPTRALFGKGTQEAVRTARTQAAIGAGVNVGTEAAAEKLQGEDLDWKRLGLAMAFGAAGQKTTGVGEKLSALGEKIGTPVATRVTEPLRTAIRGPRPEAPAVPPVAEPIAMPDADELSAHTVNGKRLTKGEWEEHRRSIGLPPREGAQPAETDLTPPKVPESDWHDTESSMNELLGRKPAEPVEPPRAEEPPVRPTEAPRSEKPPVKPTEEVKGDAAKELTAKDYEDAALKFERQALGAGDLAEAARLLEIAHRLRLRASDLTTKAPPTETKTPEPPPADQTDEGVVQNRDRRAQGYVVQMNEIAHKPRYADVSHSRNVTFGAPVVTNDQFKIPAKQYGRQDKVTLINGSEVLVRYAVVDARDVLASHAVNGAVNRDYYLPKIDKLKVVAGNGRAAGLAEGYNRNTMGGYKEAFLADDLHGIDPEVIRGMERPMLVRIISEQEVRSRPNWGDLTNISAGAELTPLEKAKNDSRRIDLTKIELSPNGSITHDTVKKFINAMPTQEQNNLMDGRSGAPNTLAYDRLNAAIFHKAYGNDDLVNLAYHATDADARNVLNALAKAAPHMMGLEKTPYDIRPQVAEAAELAVNAARNGIPLDVAARQIDINTDPVTHHILEHFGENRRSAKKMAEYLDRVATMAKAENAGGAEDMFGAKQQRSIEQILQEARTEPTDQEALFSRMSTEGKGAPVELNRPGVPFKDGMAFSPGIDRRIAGLAQAFRKDLGIGADVYVTTMRDANRDLEKFTGPYTKVTELASDPRNAGVVQQMPDGSWVMLLEDSASWAHRVETLAHEFGHIHEKEYFAHQPKAVKDAIYGEFDGWLEDSGFRTAREHVASLRARKAAKMTDIPNPQKTGADLDPYWRKFEEWYADQVSRWATTSERPLGLVGQFFHRLAESMKAFYSKLRNAKYLPNSTFKDYMDGVHERHYPNGTGEIAGPSYSKKVAETRITKPVINYKGHAIGAPTWDLPPPEKLFGFLKKSDWYTKLVDNSYNLGQATKEARRAAAESERGFNEDFDPHTKMMLYRPREAKAKLNFLEKYVEPWAEKFREANKKLGVTREDVHNYMLAKHAEEANAHIRKIGGMEDGGSGMTDAAAREFLANLPADKRQALEGLGQRAQEMLAQTRKVLLEGQLQSAGDIAAMEGYYQNYVPLNRKEGELDFVRDYKGIQGSAAVRGDFARRRKGSAKEVNDIMENIILQHERAIKKAEHNRVRLALYGMALQNPNKNFMTALNPDAIKDQVKAHEELTRLGVDPKEGMDMIALRGMPKSARLTQSETGPKVQFKMDPSKLNSQNVISLRVNGQDRFVVMNANDPAALQAALAIKGADLKVLGPWMGSIARVTRFLASVNTQYNPVFGLWNFARDTIAAPFNMTVSDLADRKGEVMKNIMPAMGGLFKEIRNPEATGYWADRVRQWKKAGGKTQYAPSFKGIEQEAIVLGDALKRLDRNTLHKAAAATFRGLAHYNDMMEGAVRVSAFDASLKKQMAAAGVERPTQPMLDKAALASQEVTVNFNKHGSNTQTFSALFAFFSSALQGANKTLDVLHGPSGRKIMAGGMALGMFQSMLLAMNDFDENQPSSYMKNKNFIIPTGDGKYIMIPLPLGLNILPSLGRTISDAALRSAGVITGTKSAGERAADVLGVFSDAFNPLGGGTLIQTMTPTIADPFVAVAQNKDAFGRPISREDMPSRPTPGYLRSRENASAAGNLIAEALNRISGGTEFQKGQISPTSDDLDYLAGQALGGAYREAKKGVETVKSGFTGEEQPLHKIPVVGKIVGDINDPASVAAQFYQNIKTMYGYKQEIQGRMKERQDVGEFLRETPEARLWSAAESFENRISELNKTRKEMIKREAAPELIKRIDDAKTRAMNQFNELVRRAQR